MIRFTFTFKDQAKTSNERPSSGGCHHIAWVNAHHQELAQVTEMLTSCFKIFKIHLPGFDDSRILPDVLSSHQPMDPGGADGGSACPH